MARNLNFIGRVHALESGSNLSGRAKRDLLVREYGQKAFDYAGNSYADLHVWTAAQCAVLVNPSFGLRKKVEELCPVTHIFESKRSIVTTYAKALRIHQWIKNFLVFVPILLAHQIARSSLGFKDWVPLPAFLCARPVFIC